MVKSALILPHFDNDEIYKMTQNLNNEKIKKNMENYIFKIYFLELPDGLREVPRASKRVPET